MTIQNVFIIGLTVFVALSVTLLVGIAWCFIKDFLEERENAAYLAKRQKETDEIDQEMEKKGVTEYMRQEHLRHIGATNQEYIETVKKTPYSVLCLLSRPSNKNCENVRL